MSIDIVLTQATPGSAGHAAVVVGIYEDRAMTEAAQALDQASGGRIGELIASEDISGKAGKVGVLHRLSGVDSPRVVVVGLGERRKFDAAAYAKAVRTAVRAVKDTAADSVLLTLPEVEVPGRDRRWNLAQAAQIADAEQALELQK